MTYHGLGLLLYSDIQLLRATKNPTRWLSKWFKVQCITFADQCNLIPFRHVWHDHWSASCLSYLPGDRSFGNFEMEWYKKGSKVTTSWDESVIEAHFVFHFSSSFRCRADFLPSIMWGSHSLDAFLPGRYTLVASFQPKRNKPSVFLPVAHYYSPRRTDSVVLAWCEPSLLFRALSLRLPLKFVLLLWHSVHVIRELMVLIKWCFWY